jgi:PAS domain S-box-containing protein
VIDLAAFQAAIETAPEAVFWMDRDGRFVYVNERACTSLGYTREELSVLHVWDIDPCVDRARWLQLWSEISVGRTMETKHCRKDGSLVPVEVSAKDLDVDGTRLRVAFVRDMSERKAVTDALRRTQSAVDRAREAIFWIKADARLVYVNDAACQSLGYAREELLGLTVPDIDPSVTLEKWAEDWRRSRETRSFVVETMHRSKSGHTFPVEVAVNFMQFEGEEYNCVYTRDISERKRAEEEKARLESQLLHSKKLETVGRLAGGVAHDFNNMLAVILGYTELIMKRLPATDPLLEDLQEIQKAASRSRDTTKQLLAFSRKQLTAPKAVDLDTLVAMAQKALLRLIGEDIDLRCPRVDGLWKVLFDPSQIDQMLVNLIVNARDAMPDGGTITIETANVRIDEAYCRNHAEATPGDYVVLAVSDDGAGMDGETLSHIFEPFFTTKDLGKGTGLGLATVYGMIKQNGGFISVDSKPGRGSTFRLYMPRTEGAIAEASIAPGPPAGRGSGTILVVEDDDMVRNLTKSMLQALGYTALTAATPDIALSLCEKLDVKIDLLMSDIVMPGMKGPELYQRVRAIRPDVTVLFMSGYASNVVIHRDMLDKEVNFLQKPFAIADLASHVRAAMR